MPSFQSEPADDNARLALGVVQTLAGGERLMQSLYRYGLNPQWTTMLPFVRLPVPANPKPEPLSNEAFRQIMLDLLADCGAPRPRWRRSIRRRCTCRCTWACTDLTSTAMAGPTPTRRCGKCSPALPGREVDEQTAARFTIAADRGDAHWLAATCTCFPPCAKCSWPTTPSTLHDYSGQMFFPTAKTKFSESPDAEPWSRQMFSDLIAFVHLLDFPGGRAAANAAAAAHLLAVVEQSPLSWAAILAETDDEQEWVPARSRRTQRSSALHDFGGNGPSVA